MSWCRWSSDNHRCDLYVYEAADGYAVHVATSRYMGPLLSAPSPLELLDDHVDHGAWLARQRAAHRVLGSAPTVPIDGPSDGISYTGLDRDGLVAVLEQLRDEGYRFPVTMLDEARELQD